MTRFKFPLLMLISGIMLLSGCTRTISKVDDHGKTEHPIFPAQSDAVRDEGAFVNTDNLKKMRAGLTKTQVYELLGVPHFKEGVFRVAEWDYVFHFIKADNSVFTCQYKVLFDSEMKAQSFYFLPENCLTTEKHPAPQPAKPLPVAKTTHDLSAQGLFAFGSSVLRQEGEDQVKRLIPTLKTQLDDQHVVVITGHTDRIGSKQKNMALSQARAESVKQLLLQEGIAAERIVVRGVGDAEPRVICPGASSPEVLQCLAPNRRMTLEVVAGQPER